MKKRVISLALSLLMLLSLVPTSAWAALSWFESYIGETGVSVNGGSEVWVSGGGSDGDLGSFTMPELSFTTNQYGTLSFKSYSSTTGSVSLLTLQNEYAIYYGSKESEALATGTQVVCSETDCTIQTGFANSEKLTGSAEMSFTCPQDGTYYLKLTATLTADDKSSTTQTYWYTFVKRTPLVTVTCDAGAGGSVTGGFADQAIPYGTAVSVSGNVLTIGANTVTAAADEGFVFRGWTTGGISFVEEDITITASFAKAHDHAGSESEAAIDTLEKLTTLLTQGGSGYLTENITMPGTSWTTVPNGVEATLCLNKHNITITGACGIMVYGTLTIDDPAADDEMGSIQGNNNNTEAIAVGGNPSYEAAEMYNAYLDSTQKVSGTLKMTGGKITGCKCGVFLNEDSVMKMTGGIITGNSSYGVFGRSTAKALSGTTEVRGADISVGGSARITKNTGKNLSLPATSFYYGSFNNTTKFNYHLKVLTGSEAPTEKMRIGITTNYMYGYENDGAIVVDSRLSSGALVGNFYLDEAIAGSYLKVNGENLKLTSRILVQPTEKIPTVVMSSARVGSDLDKPTYTYQWQRKTVHSTYDGGWYNVEGQTTPTLDLSVVEDTDYRVQITMHYQQDGADKTVAINSNKIYLKVMGTETRTAEYYDQQSFLDYGTGATLSMTVTYQNYKSSGQIKSPVVLINGSTSVDGLTVTKALTKNYSDFYNGGIDNGTSASDTFTIKAEKTLAPGSYSICVTTATATNIYDSYVAPRISSFILNVGKIEWQACEASGQAPIGKTNQYILLKLPDGLTSSDISDITVRKGDSASTDIYNVAVDGANKKLTFDVKSGLAENQAYTVTFHATETDFSKAFDYTVTVTTTNRLDISDMIDTSQMAASDTYDGAALTTGTATVPGHDVQLTYQWYKVTDKTVSPVTREAIASAPTNAGDYQLDIAVAAASQDEYTGSKTLDITISPKTVTVTKGTWAITKVYDGTSDGSVGTVTGALAVSGILEQDSGVQVAISRSNYQSSKGNNAVQVSTIKQMTLTLSLTGNDNGNYQLGTTSVKVPASVTKKTVTVTDIVVNDRAYDGTKTVTLKSCTIAGKVSADTLTPKATYTIEDANVGNGKTVTITLTGLSGDKAANYTLDTANSQKTTTVNITKAVPAAGNFTFTAPASLEYSGEEKAATVVINTKKAAYLTGQLGTLTVKYSSDGGTTWSTDAPTNAGTYKVSVSAPETDNVASVTNLTASSWTFTITQKALTPSVSAVDSKTYDGTTATTGGTIALSGAIGDEKPTATATVIWSDAAVGTKTVEVSDITLGAGWENYKLSTTTLSAVTPANTPGITNAAFTGISIKQDGTLAYTGQALTAAVKATATSVNAQPVSFYYCAAQEGVYSSNIPAFTDVGEHTVYYKVKAQNHSDATGSFTVTIGKGVASETNAMTTPVTASTTSLTITAAKGVEYYVSTSETAPDPWPGSGNSYYKAAADGEHTFTGLSTDTKYYVYYRIAETDNYAASTAVKSVSAYTLAGGPAAGCATVDYAAETISYDDTLYELFTGSNGTGSAVASGDTVTPGTTLYLRTKATAEKPASVDTAIVLPNRPATPAKPTEASRTDVAVSLETVSGCEYKVGSDNWTDSTTFSELTASNSYTFYQRVKATANSFASLPGGGLVLTTKAAAGAAPEAEVLSVTQSSVTLSTGTDWEYSNDGGNTWTDKNNYTGLSAATAYTYQVRIKGTDTAMPSLAKTVTAYTAHKTPAAGEGYTMNGLNITVQEGYEVVEKASSGSQSWDSPITGASGATALTAGKEYLIRKAQTGTEPEVYPASEAVSFYSLPLPTADLIDITTPTDATYTGKPIAVTAKAKNTTVGLGTITVEYSSDSGTTWVKEAPTDVGTYKVHLSIAVGTGYAAAVLPCEDLVIAAAAPKVTAPQAKTALVYDNTDQTLAASGSTQDGTVYYALSASGTAAPSDGDWLTAIPTGKTAGTYHVWYYVKGDKNHLDTTPAELDVTIGRASYDMSGVHFTDATRTYTGEEQGLTVSGTLPTGLDGVQVTVSYSAGQKDAGSKKITATFATTSLNYETPAAMKATITVTKAALSDISVQQSGTLTYNGKAQSAIVTATAASVDTKNAVFRYSTAANGTYAAAVPGFTDAGTYTVYYKAALANHKDATGSFTVTIDRKEITISGITAESKTYDNTVVATLAYSGVQFGGLVSGDTLSVTAVGTFTDVSVGESKTVNLSGLTLGGRSLANYVLAEEGQQTTAAANITPRAVTAKWTNTEQVYTGEALVPTAQFINAAAGDSLTPVFDADNTKSASGSYSLTAGLNNENYTLTNPYVNLVIQKAPVTFTVTDDTVKASGAACRAVISNDKSLAEGIDYTVVYKDTQGKTVDAPASVGNYEIYVVFTGDNYRLAGTSGSKENKVGVLTIYGSSAPAAYKIGFSGGDGATGSMNEITAVKSGESVILPDCGFTKAGYTFTGWKYGSSIYKAGTVFTQPANNVTLAAQWAEGVFSVSGVVYSSTGAVQPNAVVTLSAGARQIGQVITDSNGAFRFDNVTPGLYNLSASYDGITVTKAVQIGKESVAETITLPAGRTNSVVEVSAGTPEIVVSGLEDSFTDTTGNYTAADAAIIRGGGSVEFKLAVEEASSLTETQEAQMKKKSGDNFLYLNLDLSKTTIDSHSVRSVTPLYEADNLLAITIMLPAEMQGKSSYHVYRFHSDDGSAENETLGELKRLSGKSQPTEEGYEFSEDGTFITVYTSSFSLYAVGYTEYSGGGSSGGYTITSDLKDIAKVTVDGKAVSSAYYSIFGGNVTLTQAYLNTLTNGRHTVKLENATHIATAVITVNHGRIVVVSAPTGDRGIVLYVGLTIAALMGAAYVTGKRKVF